MDYQAAHQKIKLLVNETESLSIIDEVVAYLYEHFDHYSWIGIYLVEGAELVLGPWRGKKATEHTRIPIGKGICGSAAASGKTEVIDDVAADDRYLACFISTKSEIVVPIQKDGKIVGEIDIDSDTPNAFSHEDAAFLESIAELLSRYL